MAVCAQSASTSASETELGIRISAIALKISIRLFTRCIFQINK